MLISTLIILLPLLHCTCCSKLEPYRYLTPSPMPTKPTTLYQAYLLKEIKAYSSGCTGVEGPVCKAEIRFTPKCPGNPRTPGKLLSARLEKRNRVTGTIKDPEGEEEYDQHGVMVGKSYESQSFQIRPEPSGKAFRVSRPTCQFDQIGSNVHQNDPKKFNAATLRWYRQFTHLVTNASSWHVIFSVQCGDLICEPSRCISGPQCQTVKGAELRDIYGVMYSKGGPEDRFCPGATPSGTIPMASCEKKKTEKKKS